MTEAVQQSVAARQISKFQEDNRPDHDELIKSITDDLKGEVVLSDYVKNENGRIVGNNFRKTTIAKSTQRQWRKALVNYLYLGDDSGMTPMLYNYLRNNKSGTFSLNNFSQEVFNAKKTQEEFEADLKDLKDTYGYVEPAKKSGPTGENLQKVYDQAAKDYKEAAKKVADMKKNRSAYTDKQWEDAQAELKSAKDAYENAGGEIKTKKSTGPTSAQIESKETSAHQKLIDLMKQQAEERLKLQQDYEYQQWQNRIDLMEEGEAKVLAQMRLDQEKERASLEEQKKQAIQAEIARQKAVFDARQDEIAAANKKYAKQVFDPGTDIDQAQIKVITDRYDALNSDLLAKQQKANADRLQAAKDAMNAYLKEFGSYEEKRAAIAEEYNRKISEAGTLGDKLQLQGEKRKALGDADFEQFKKSGSMSLAFGDVSGLTKETIRGLISDLEKYREKATETFDPEKIREYDKALSGLREAEIEGLFGMLGDMVPEYFKKRISLQEELNDKETEALITEQKQKDLQKQINDQRAKVATLAVIAPDSKEYKAAVNELTRMEAEEDAAATQSERLNNEIKVLAERIKGLDGEEKFKAIAEAVGNVAGLVGDLANQASEMADAMGAEGLGKALGYLGEAMGSVQNVASGFAQGGLVGGIAAAAGEAMKWVTKLFQAGDARHQRNIERLQEQIDALGKSYEKVGKAADKAYSTDASKLINQQNTLLEQQQALIRQQIAEEEAKKKTDKGKIKEWKEQLDEINETLGENAEKAKEAIVGKDIKSALDEFASLYAGAWDDGTDAAQKSMAAVKSIISGALTELLKKNIQPAAQNFYDTLAKAMEDGILTDAELANLDTIKAQMDALAATGEEQYKKIQERYKDLDELREELTDISFDSVRDNFKSLLSDMTSTTEDFTENWTDMVRNALIEGLMDNKYDKMLKEWYDEFAEAMNDQALTSSERDALKQKYDAIVQQGIADRNAINAIVGGGAYSQQASKGEAWGMTQETGEELNGRFTAMVELEATNNTLVSDGNAIAREILVTLRSMSGLSMTVTGNGDNEALLAIKDMMFLSTGYLEDIAKYSKLLADISSDVSEMKSAVKDL